MGRGQGSSAGSQHASRSRGSLLWGLSLAAAVAAGAALSGQSPREWRDYAGGPDSSRFVASTQITKANVGQLEVAWTYPAGLTDFNPLVVRGTVYARGEANSFVALDAATGKQLWIYKGAPNFNGRGVNYWESRDGKDRRLIFSAGNLLQELDAVTGEPISSFGQGGTVDLRVGLDRDPTTISQQTRTPGRVFENLIILGSATNQEYDSAPGDIRAFNVRTGALVWTFHTVPRPGEFGYDTWPPRRLEDGRRREQLGGAVDRREARDRLRADRQPEIQLLRRQSQGREPVRRLPHRARRQNRKTPLAFPDGASRHLGSRQQLRAAADDDPPRTAAPSTSSPWPARPATSTCSTASPGGRSGRSKNVRCPRTRRCRVRSCRRRSHSRPRRRRSRGRSSRSTT